MTFFFFLSINHLSAAPTLKWRRPILRRCELCRRRRYLTTTFETPERFRCQRRRLNSCFRGAAKTVRRLSKLFHSCVTRARRLGEDFAHGVVPRKKRWFTADATDRPTAIGILRTLGDPDCDFAGPNIWVSGRLSRGRRGSAHVTRAKLAEEKGGGACALPASLRNKNCDRGLRAVEAAVEAIRPGIRTPGYAVVSMIAPLRRELVGVVSELAPRALKRI